MGAISGIEIRGTFSGKFKMLTLVFAHGNMCRPVDVYLVKRLPGVVIVRTCGLECLRLGERDMRRDQA
jgi:hypothetical protein